MGVKDLVQLCFTYLLALFYGVPIFFRIVIGILIYGPSKVLGTKDHSRRPQELDDPELGEHSFIQLQEVQLHIVSKGDTNKPLMLLVHGFPEFWYCWRHQIKEFSKTHRVVAVDMRGYSESDKPKGVHNYSIDKLIKDIKDLVLALDFRNVYRLLDMSGLSVQKGYKQCILVGHDWGAAVSWCVASVYPEIVERLVIMNGPHGKAYQKLIKTSKDQFKKSWYVFLFQLPWLPEVMMSGGDFQGLMNSFTQQPMGAKKGTYTAEDLETIKYTFRTRDRITGPLNYYRATLRYPNITRSLNQDIYAPTLIIWGTGDQALHHDIAKLSMKYVKNKLCYIENLEGGSHWIQEEMPTEVNKCMRDFLDKPVPSD